MAGGAALNKSSPTASVMSVEPEEASEPQEVTPLRKSTSNITIDPDAVELQEQNGVHATFPRATGCHNGSVAIIEKLQIGETTDERVLGNDEFGEASAEEGCCFGSIEVDSLQSWIVAFSCAWVMFWSLLVNRTSSVIYVSLSEELGMPREEAATPFSMLGTVSNIFAVVSGLLIRLMPLHRVSALGTVLTGLGIVLAAGFFDRLAIKYCIGIITAIGQSLIFPTHMVAVNTYFDKHRSTASGISYIGGTLVSFVMPDVYEALVKRFGLRVTLAIIGALTLNALLGALVLRIPARPKQPNMSSCNNNTPILTDADKVKPSRQILHFKEVWNNPRQQFAFMKRPIFYLIVVSGIVFAYVLVLFNVTVVAFAKERSYKEPTITLWFYAGGDLIGRLFSGQLSDRGWLRRRTVIATGFLLASVATFGMAISPYRGLYFAFCLLFGLAMGSVMILFSVLITEYLGLVNLPLAVGVHCLINGLTALPRQHLIRYLSQEGSSYWPLYLFMSIASVVIAIVWALHCLFIDFRSRIDSKRRHKSDEEKHSPELFKLAEKVHADREDCPQATPNTETVTN